MVNVPMLVLRLMVHGELEGAKALFLDFGGFQSQTGDAKRIDAGLHGGQRNAGVDQRRKRHVAADSALAIEVSDSHVFESGRPSKATLHDGLGRPRHSVVIDSDHVRGQNAKYTRMVACDASG